MKTKVLLEVLTLYAAHLLALTSFAQAGDEHAHTKVADRKSVTT